MQADLRLVPSTSIWYCYRGKYYQGLVTELRKNGQGDLLISSNMFGDRWEILDAPYGREKDRHWYFRDVNDATITILENLGVELNEDEKQPAYFIRKPVEEIDIKSIVEETLAELKEVENGASDVPATKVANARKHKA